MLAVLVTPWELSREALACFEVAAPLWHLPELDEALRDRFGHVLGTLVRLVGGD